MAAEIESAVQSLASTGAAIQALLAGLTAADAKWNPAVNRWSLIEVINHLIDEEVYYAGDW